MLLGQEVHYYMVHIAYITELILQICDYAQKRRIWRENCIYALDENFHCHFCSRWKAAKFCHPELTRSDSPAAALVLVKIIYFLLISLREIDTEEVEQDKEGLAKVTAKVTTSIDILYLDTSSTIRDYTNLLSFAGKLTINFVPTSSECDSKKLISLGKLM